MSLREDACVSRDRRRFGWFLFDLISAHLASLRHQEGTNLTSSAFMATGKVGGFKSLGARFSWGSCCGRARSFTRSDDTERPDGCSLPVSGLAHDLDLHIPFPNTGVPRPSDRA